jgi:predicted phage tail protein
MGIFRKCLPLTALFLTGCGYVGEALPPALNIPKRVTDLRVIERADKAFVDFTVQELTTEELPLRLGRIELQAETGAQPQTLDTSTVLKPAAVHLEYPVRGWVNQEVRFRVRVFSRQGRDSGWSDSVTLRVVAPLDTPSELKVEAVAQGVRLQWTGAASPAGTAFRVWKRSGEEKTAAEAAMVAAREWVDADTRYGVLYDYSVQAVNKSGGANAESEIRGPVSITPVDTFPPAVPAGLTALAGAASIELTWDRDTEPDLAGYYLYRAAAGGEFARLGGLLETPAYSDREVKPAIRYRYAVSSVDRTGNESGRSGPVEAGLP